MIVFDSVTKKYKNGTVALNDVSFAIGARELVVITGQSGAGKTTLMRSMIRDIDIDAGKIVIDGDDIAQIPPRNIPLLRRKIGVVFQDFKILVDRTVAENIDLSLDILGLSESIAKKRRKELLELTGLSGKEYDFPSQLSGGELQRVAIARSLSPEPKILFADEPTGNLDEKTGHTIMNLLRDINEAGTTVVIASHDLDLLKGLGARRINMEGGKVVSDSGAHHHKKHTDQKATSDSGKTSPEQAEGEDAND